MTAVKKRRRRSYPKKHKDFLNIHRHKYEAILKLQGGKCALCPRRPSLNRRLDLDHHHGDMRIRGLLCWRCNRALKEWMDEEWFINGAKFVKNNYNDFKC